MAVGYNPKTVTQGLIFYYDMGNPYNSWIGPPATNSVDGLTQAIARYNNPGFSGAAVDTGMKYLGMPIYELSFIPQDASYISRLASGEGFGAFHAMGTSLLANTRYMASIFFRTGYPLENSSSQGFNHGYSNIPGWAANGTTSTRYQQADGWTRLYTQYFNNANGYSTRTSTFQRSFVVNTTSTQNVDLTFTVQADGANISDFSFLYALVSANPAIASNGGLTGLSIVNHGLDTTSFTKLAWPSPIKLRPGDLPFNYFVRVSVPSTGGVNTTILINANFEGYYTALTDNKFWKVTFNTAGLAVNEVIRTYWTCPMIEQTSVLWPSTYVNGTRSNTQALLDMVGQNTVTANSLSYTNTGLFTFNNANNNFVSFPENPAFNSQSQTVEVWIKTNALSQNGFWFEKGQVNTQYSLFQEGSTIVWRHNFTDTVLDSQTVTTANFINTSNWAHIVGTYGNGLKRIYINGQLVASKSESRTVVTNANGCSIGVYGGFTGSRGYYYNGDIGIVKVYNRALTETEVSQNFDALRGRYGI